MKLKALENGGVYKKFANIAASGNLEITVPSQTVGVLTLKWVASNDSYYGIYGIICRDDGFISFSEILTSSFYDATIIVTGTTNKLNLELSKGTPGGYLVAEIIGQ
ncbi:hypothetical protein [Aquimarina macrocephali]|uniref:hypothetical protein n=1 Tax=Aquimarina macrocephali TaxID=666563 RepID=UPI000467A583|nr:hypothetical protein [Aquimarina macrocephali]